MYIIWPTEQRDQILNGHWLKIWSRDTYFGVSLYPLSFYVNSPFKFFKD